LPTDIATGIIFLVLSYIVGVILSGFSEVVFSKVRSYKNIIPLPDDVRTAVIEAFNDTFKISKDTKIEWSSNHFYLCRSLVVEYMPSVLPPIQRQSGLRQLRINLLPSLFIWLGVGLGWGRWTVANNATTEGVVLIVTSTVLFFLITAITFNRARSNEWREVREVLTAFLAGYRTGIFREKNKVQGMRAPNRRIRPI
jgi:uncharacterized membrane protein YbaN (DUF454 family)